MTLTKGLTWLAWAFVALFLFAIVFVWLAEARIVAAGLASIGFGVGLFMLIMSRTRGDKRMRESVAIVLLLAMVLMVTGGATAVVVGALLFFSS